MSADDVRGRVKCVAWDLDDTVWSGTLLEDGDVHVRPEIVAAMRTLDARGVLNSIASRNDADLALARLRATGLDELVLHPQIGWGAKSVAIPGSPSSWASDWTRSPSSTTSPSSVLRCPSRCRRCCASTRPTSCPPSRPGPSSATIGLALVDRGSRPWHLRLLLMSCRVVARGVGTVLLNHILALAHGAGAGVRGDFVHNDRNRTMYITYKVAGFDEVSREGNVVVLERGADEAPPPPPSYLTLVTEPPGD